MKRRYEENKIRLLLWLLHTTTGETPVATVTIRLKGSDGEAIAGVKEAF